MAAPKPDPSYHDNSRRPKGLTSPNNATVLLGTTLALVALLVAATLTNRGPIHSIGCILDGRSGWTIDLPEQPTPLHDFENLVDDQTDNCVRVSVEAGPTGGDAVVITPIGAKTWVLSDRRLTVTTT